MKTLIIAFTTSLLLAATTPVMAGEIPSDAAHKSSAEFERMKSLVGTWKGKADMGQGPVDLTLEYRLIAGGTLLEERVFAGTPHEMVTMYYDKGGKLALTHYCVMGNRPGMLLASSDARTLRFDFDKTCGIDAAVEDHMHALTITFEDSNTITSTCKAVIGGKLVENAPTTLKRVES